MYSIPYLLIGGLQIAALVHYFKTRPEGYWFWIIIFLPPFGAVVYFLASTFDSDGGRGLGDMVKAGMKERNRVKRLEAKHRAGEALPYDLFELGELRFKLGRYEQAVEVLEESVKQAPENLEARFFLGLAQEQMDDFEQAGRILEWLVMRDPKFKFGEAMLALARCYHAAGETDAAENAYKRVLSQSSFSEARFRLAELYVGRSENDKAKELLDQLITDAAVADIPLFKRSEEKKWVRRAKLMLAGL